MGHKLTIDVNVFHEEPITTAVKTLKRWKEEGKVEFTEVDPPKGASNATFGWPGAPPKTTPVDSGGRRFRARVKKDPAGPVNFKSVAQLLFPYKDAHKLSMGEINDVAHLVRHHESKNGYFVTKNALCFLESGKRELLKSAIGVVAITPEEIVTLLKKTEGWK